MAGNKLWPQLGDWYLARTNVKGQQTGEPLPGEWEDYLDTPIPEDRGAHGPFDGEAKETSIQWRLTRHRRALLAGVGLAAAGVAARRAR